MEEEVNLTGSLSSPFFQETLEIGEAGELSPCVFSREALKTYKSDASPRGLENPKGSQNSAIKQTWVLILALSLLGNVTLEVV